MASKATSLSLFSTSGVEAPAAWTCSQEECCFETKKQRTIDGPFIPFISFWHHVAVTIQDEEGPHVVAQKSLKI